MGRSSKFSFPMPGQKHSHRDKNHDSAKPPAPSGHMSKAQRILGTDNDLNIDSPIRSQDPGWEYPSSRSSAMSVSISESSRSTNENESIHSSQSRQWDRESGVFPRPPRQPNTKASSTALGNRYGDDGLTSTSGASGRLRNEDSSSTLKSYYDRQKLPLAISQQTSASSARDLALRKGYSPAIPRSPLLQVQTPIGSSESQYTNERVHVREQDTSLDIGFKKKHSKLDLSRLFRSRHHGDKASETASMAPSTISMATNGTRMTGYPDSEMGPKKLKKARSRESIQSQNYSVRSNQSHNVEKHKTNGTLLQLYENYEHLPSRPSHMGSIPESGVPESRGAINPARFPQPPRMMRDQDSYPPSIEEEPFSWKNVPVGMVAPPWETSSAASVSSRNTKTSRRTGSSTMSHSDLKQVSVLSLSSGSDSDDEPEPARSSNGAPNKTPRPADAPSQRTREGMRQTSQQPKGSTLRNQGKRDSSFTQHSQFLELPKSLPASSRLSGPWAPPPAGMFEPQSQKQSQRMSTQREPAGSDKAPSIPSIASKRSSQQPTPPLSPSSVEFRQTSDRSSRFMAVTKQEEALLEALRQKRARMREAIIEEHETAKVPAPRIPPRSASRISAASSVSTVRGPGGKQRVLLFLDTPISETQSIDTAEPSPDLSDFLSFGSDDDSTPRASWAPSKKGRPRPDSVVSPSYGGRALSPMNPPPAPRISAVGGRDGFKQHAGLPLETKKRNTGVRFADDAKNEPGFSVDEDENEGVWGM